MCSEPYDSWYMTSVSGPVFVKMQPLMAKIMVDGFHVDLNMQLLGYCDQVSVCFGCLAQFFNNSRQARSELAMSVQCSSIHMRALRKGEHDCTLNWVCSTALSIEESVCI